MCLDLITRRELEWNVQYDRLVLFIITLYILKSQTFCFSLIKVLQEFRGAIIICSREQKLLLQILKDSSLFLLSWCSLQCLLKITEYFFNQSTLYITRGGKHLIEIDVCLKYLIGFKSNGFLFYSNIKFERFFLSLSLSLVERKQHGNVSFRVFSYV